ncbi:hypothetical protein PENTCL1PPCAC_23072, partial [Pristionchus entomophagus]
PDRSLLSRSLHVRRRGLLYYLEDTDNSYFMESSISNLIDYYKKTQTALPSSSIVKLKRGIWRSQWSMNHDDIHIIKKLGQRNSLEETYMAKFICERRPFMDQQAVVAMTLTSEANRVQRLTFLTEARMMRKLVHPNFVNISHESDR